MRADRTAPCARVLLDEFHARFEPLDVEGRADFVPFDLAVGIVAEADAGLKLFEHAAAQCQFAAQIGAELVEVDRHFLVLAAARADRYAIDRVVNADRGTQIAFAGEESCTDIAGVGFGRTTRQSAAKVSKIAKFARRIGIGTGNVVCLRQEFGTQRGRSDITANPEIAGLAPRAISMNDEFRSDRKIDRQACLALVGNGIEASEPVDMDRFRRDAQRNSLVDHIDRAPDRLAAEQHHSRSAQDFDTLGRERVDGHSVVGRGIGDVDRTEPVDQHADPVAREAAQDGARGAWRKSGRRNTRQFGKHFADLSGHLALQFKRFDHRCPGEQVELLQTGSRDDDIALIVERAAVKIVLPRVCTVGGDLALRRFRILLRFRRVGLLRICRDRCERHGKDARKCETGDGLSCFHREGRRFHRYIM